MRLLITIPHYFDHSTAGGHGSLGDPETARLAALTQALRGLRGHFGDAQASWYRVDDRLAAGVANDDYRLTLDIAICTTRGAHLLQQLPVPAGLYRHHESDAEPRLLGYECHALLAGALGSYDLYGYMEDDLILHDPAFFRKLAWFGQLADAGCVLQPNRFELSYSATEIKKVYIDFEFKVDVEAAEDSLQGQVLGQVIHFQRASNPHAGCFFLTQRQMQLWSLQPYFLDRETRFVGPLESAASLGILRTFRVYKPAVRNASFLEIQHAGQAWSRKLPHVRFAAKETFA